MTASIRPLILCGGSGTRLWPVSRDTMPKQFIVLRGEHSSFQETMLRVADRDIFGFPVIVTAEAHRFEVERQLKAIEMEATLILEPDRRDSGPAILAGCMLVASEGAGDIVAVLASDHVIEDRVAFTNSMVTGRAAAMQGRIVTFGITPTHPTTGYGYIEPGGTVSPGVLEIRRFAEKPDAATAQRYIAEGYLWNSGNFLVRPGALIAEYERLQPEGFAAVKRAFIGRTRKSGAISLHKTAYAQAKRISIDYAVMEATNVATVVRSDWGWSDVGTWDALWEISAHDDDGNAWSGETQNLGSHDCYVRSRGQLTSVIGAKDLIVIVEPDAVLIADRKNASDVKLLVETLRRQGVPQATSHARVHRPWGWYEVRDLGSNFQVKRIGVYPGGRLSLQKHRFRAEHWVVVTGTARVTVDDTVRTLVQNEHAEIPLGAIHRLENPGDTLLEIVEVQHGSYLGEDDIIRIEDIYDRVEPVLHAAE